MLAWISYGFYVHIGIGETYQNQLELCVSCHRLRDVKVVKFIRHFFNLLITIYKIKEQMLDPLKNYQWIYYIKFWHVVTLNEPKIVDNNSYD